MTRIDADILTVDDLAKLFSCDKETAAARLTCGDLPGVKVGRGWVIPRQALLERLNEKAQAEASARRAQQTAARDIATRRGIENQLSQSDLKNMPLSIAAPAAQVEQRGRKRRKPPALPRLII